MRRALVLTDESARHPFRATLPPHVRTAAPAEIKERRPFDTTDLRHFLMAYCACFLAVSAFLL